MGIQISEAGHVAIPQVPPRLKAENSELYEFLQGFKRAVELLPDQFLANTFIIATAMNSGTSGTFTLSS